VVGELQLERFEERPQLGIRGICEPVAEDRQPVEQWGDCAKARRSCLRLGIEGGEAGVPLGDRLFELGDASRHPPSQ